MKNQLSLGKARAKEKARRAAHYATGHSLSIRCPTSQKPMPGNEKDADLKTWLKRVQDQAWKDAFVFFKHEDEGKGPQLAKRFLELAG
jgi:uncharacterized protein YecE (DUF72 family)